MIDSHLFSIRVEKHFLSGYLKFPNIYPEVDNMVTEYDFYHEIHSTIYCIARNCYRKNEPFDKIILGQKIKNLNINFKDDINIFDYIDDLYFSQITQDATLKTAKELISFRIKREIHETATKIQEAIKKHGHDIEKIIQECDAIYNEKISQYEFTKQPEDLFEGIAEIIEERAASPREEAGLITPFKEFNRLYGGIRMGNVYAIVSRMGEGKTTILDDLSLRTSYINKGVRTLILDTEMDTIDIKFRCASAVTQIPLWFLETGQYYKYNDYVDLYNKNKPEFKKFEKLVDHLNVSMKPIDEIISIIKRWYYKKVGRGNPAIIVYDYVKLTGEMEKNKQEYQLIGDKVNKLKEISLELNCAILTACQANRSGVAGKEKEIIDDSSIIAQSDRLAWFATFVAIFRRKTTDEITEDGLKFGTHKLIPLKTRFQGKDAAGHHDLVKIKDPHSQKIKWVNNFLNFGVKNFKIEEIGSLRDIINDHNQIHELKDKNKKDDGTLI